jgi:sarcosine oxidase gamma subunit
VQTALARVHAIVRQVDAVPTYDVWVERSYARYVWIWLVDAAREYGVEG